MDQAELLNTAVAILERLKIPYLITGSMATINYGEPRFTNDIDMVVDLHESQVDDFCDAFPSPDFYCSQDAVRHAVAKHFQFNILHPASGLKIDVMIPEESEFNHSRLARGRDLPTGASGMARFASPEDVIIKKLEYFKLGGSEKHLRDIIGVLQVQGAWIDREYIENWCARLELEKEWQTALALNE